MQAMMKDKNGVYVISIGGTLDIEYTQVFKENCLKQLKQKKVIFNMENANFVGSTGLQSFIETLKGLSFNEYGIKLVNPKNEFRRLFQNLEIQNLQIHENEENALASFLSLEVPLVSDSTQD
jgi:anti-anti-sigma factor